MENKRLRRATILCLLATCLSCTFVFAASAQNPPQNGFTVHDASRLLNQINDALINRQPGRFLAAFDLAKMADGQLFKQQVTSFISHSDSIRLHFNITETAMNGAQGAATVDAEMEADPRDGNTPPVRKQATLRFVAEHTSPGWKFTDVQPRSFFSMSSGAAPPAATPSQLR
jgi:hypothetical protein